ncbi:protein-L-isoaspartate O-methyltransferase family protein [Basilea psittacipulmonis]|nr:protein-L-isoaspartate O-methyltransferase [Basilea psittacipulmonis]
MMDIEKARFNMVEQQIRPWEVVDKRVIEALFNVKREQFVPKQYINSAFTDMKIPLKIEGIKYSCATMLEPKIEARLAQELTLKESDSVLEIGTGSGYQAALLSKLCGNVVSVEIDQSLVDFAKANLKQANISNVVVEHGDGHKGWTSSIFDAILVTGSMPDIPDSLKYQLAEGGRLVAIIGEAPAMSVVRITRVGAAEFKEESLFETYVPKLKGISTTKFHF